MPPSATTFMNYCSTTLQYAAGNMTSDPQALQYDAASRQVSAVFAPNGWNIQQGYDGDGQRARKTDGGVVTYYLRSAVLGGQVVGELNGGGGWTRGYVYLGSQMLAIQQGNSVQWVHQDPVTKSQRVTDGNGNVVSTIDLDPWGGETTKSSNQTFQPHRFTTYERDAGRSDDALARRYNRWHSRFDQPDPYRGSYDLADPQSFNRYSYVQDDPVNFVDPTGLGRTCIYFVEGEFTTGYDSHHSQAYEYGFGFCFDNSLSSRALPGGGDNDSQPRIPPPTIDGLLQNERCRNFLDALLGKLKDITGIAPYRDNFRDLYIVASSGFYDGKLKEGDLGEAHGNVGSPSLQIILDTSQATANGINALEYTAIHEVIHVAAPRGYNGHDVMAQAAWAVGTAQGLLGRFPNSGFAGGPKKKDEAGANGYNSDLFDQALYAACGPK